MVIGYGAYWGCSDYHNHDVPTLVKVSPVVLLGVFFEFVIVLHLYIKQVVVGIVRRERAE